MRVNSLTSTCLWTALIGLELWILLADVNLISPPSYVDGSTPAGEKVANLNRRENTVQIQNSGDLVWSEAHEGDTLYEGQSLLTLGKSEASVKFEGANEIIVAENSLIQIQRPPSHDSNGGSLKLALLRGEIRSTGQSSRTSRMEIVMGKRIAVIEGAGEFVARAPLTEGESPTLEVTEGTLTLRSPSGGEAIELSQGKKIEITESAPLTSAIQDTAPLAEAVVSEVPEAKAETPAVVPAKKRSRNLPPPKLMNPPKIRKKPKVEPTNTPASGAWLRRLFWISEAHAESADPYADETWEIELTWNAVNRAKGYVIQIAKDRTFKSVITQDRTDSPTYLWNYQFGMENSKGRVFYRVATENEDGKPGKFSDADMIVLPKREVLIAQKEAEPPKPVPPPLPPAPVPHAWNRSSISLGAQMTSFTQSSGLRNLEEVKTGTLFLQEALAFRFEVLRDQRFFELSAAFDPAHFESSGDRHPNQSEVKTFALKILGLRWNEDRYRKRLWSFGYGVLLDRSYHFEKKSLTTVEPVNAYAAGAALGFRKRNGAERGLIPAELRLAFGAPLTGFLMDAQYGLRAEFAVDWNLNRSGSLGLTFRTEGGMLKYDEPLETSVVTYGASLLFTHRWLDVKGMR